MAIIHVTVYSKSFERNLPFTVILPVEQQWEKGNHSHKFPTLYLLHGYTGNEEDWLYETRVSLYAKEKGLALVLPYAGNSYYVDREDIRENGARFTGEEMLKITRDIFPLSPKREDTFIAGASMGGYGAMRNGLAYGENFAAIGAFSSGFLVEALTRYAGGSSEPVLRGKEDYYKGVFGDLTQLKGSNNDYKALIDNRLSSGKIIPRLWMTCGKEDFFIEENRDFYQYLVEKKVPVTYTEEKGGHQWPYWDKAIKDFLAWL